MEGLLDWLSGLPPAALVGAMAVLAAVENIFPPIPADVLVAFGAFLAARGDQSPVPAFLAVWTGNIAGAMLMFFLGRHFGSAWIERKFHLKEQGRARERLDEWYRKYGVGAFFVSRFLPAIRAVLPPVAGAMRAPAFAVAAAMALASGIWYGLITWLAFRAGGNWEQLSATIGRLGRWFALGAGVVAVVGAAVWFLHRRRRAAR